MKDNSLKKTGDIVQAPEFILPWLDRFYEPFDIKLLEAFLPPVMEVTDLLQTTGINHKTLDRLLLRGILETDKDGHISPADFHTRYDLWALFEGFKDLPDDIRHQLNQWELEEYIRSHKPDVEQVRKTGRLDPSKVLPRYLLIDEAFSVIDEAEHIYLWPCNCRSMIQACKKQIFTCLRFDNSQGQGYEISRERAKEIVLEANRKGLIQSGELGWDKNGKLMGAICNCCTDCCFPHLLADKENAQKIWPKSLAVAHWLESECSFCGICAKRCPFNAFEFNPKEKKKTARLTYDKDYCRGCGLCFVTCPEKAIEMKKIRERL